MNYRHAYHAGNFADVFKHVILARMIVYMQRKEKAFRVYDTHSGPGIYNLTGEEAEKTGEHSLGVGRILKAEIPPKVQDILSPWLAAVRNQSEGYYPGSPVIARHLLRKQDRLSLYELHGEDFGSLATLFRGDYQVRVNNLDGWLVSGAHLPPKEGRGLVLIDPPFELEGEFDRMIDALQKSSKRWRGGTVALWYPVKRRLHTDEWLGTIRSLALGEVLNAEITVRAPESPNSLNGCGMVILNPPYVLEQELKAILPWLSKTLSQGDGSGFRIQHLGKA